jgi:predicted nucleic acid-binding protein
MAFLFDTDAISELLRPKPRSGYLKWLKSVSREDQFTSALTVGELFKGAYRSPAAKRHIKNIEEKILPAVTVLPFDVATARVFGQIQAHLEDKGRPLADPDLLIAATAIFHGLELVTGNLKHFQRVPGLTINPILAESV